MLVTLVVGYDGLMGGHMGVRDRDTECEHDI